ncbi:HlyC/CorC family transporter [Lacrimispora amygdalina]|uniref:HlyC/CorC family transporter n=1 Tax=Lacrimispora amygdalina TaxID=253257 RepID=A0A3E2N6N8_9FIRM|nr:hemolysin family protein [Clostridium indicum]RFZ76663.1 HlyC/CorC family transporter [Clostridium indicum]
METDPGAAQIAAQILLLIALTVMNAFFAGAEMAVVSVNKNRIRMLADGGNKKASLIQKLSEDSTGFLSTIQVAITFAGFFSSASAATGISQVLGVKLDLLGIPYARSLSMVAVTILLSYFNLVFGELVPKRIALQKAEKFSMFAVGPIYAISKVMAPFIKLLSISTNGVLKILGMKTENLDEEVSEEEIRSMLQTGRESGVFNKIEEEMIKSIFLFDDKRAREIMTPRQDMITIDIGQPVDQVLHNILNTRHSRIPVYEGEIDNIIGILSMKDFSIEMTRMDPNTIDIRTILQKPYFIPENKKTDNLFLEMQKKKLKLAILIDEYGGVSGLVTMEDLIEEIVGDIQDEYEESEPQLTELEPFVFKASGGISLYDLDGVLHEKIDSSCDTLSGYLIELLGFIPMQSQIPMEIQDESNHYTILEAEDRVIKKVIIRIKDKIK